MDSCLMGIYISINTEAVKQWLADAAHVGKFDNCEEVVIMLDNIRYSMSIKELKERLEK